jgi:hypothetical protein
MSGRAGGRRGGLTILGVVCVCVGSGRASWWCVCVCIAATTTGIDMTKKGGIGGWKRGIALEGACLTTAERGPGSASSAEIHTARPSLLKRRLAGW